MSDEGQPLTLGTAGPQGDDAGKTESAPGPVEQSPNDGSLAAEGLTIGVDRSAGAASGEPADNDLYSAGVTPSSQHNEIPPRRYFYLTNRLNLNGALSSRIVAPREAYDKYYADLLDRCPGWVPLLAIAPPPSLVNSVTVERGAGGPVIVEFTGEIHGLQTSEGSEFVYAPAIPMCDAVAIHVPDRKAQRELLARSYKNVHAYDDLIRITPELFAGDMEVGDPAPPAAVTPVNWQLIDRVRGALSAAISAADSGEQLALVARCLGAAVDEGVADDTIPWLNMSVLNDFERGAMDAGNRSLPTSDSLLFEAVYGVLARMDASTAWSPRAFLDKVTQAVVSDSTELSGGDIHRNLHRVRQIVGVEDEFKPFPDKGGLVSAKAMLLFSLRVDLAELNSWPIEETGADDGTRVVAAIFAGRLRGLAREDTRLRSKEFDDITARWAVGVATGEELPLGDVTFVSHNDRTELQVGGALLRRADALLPDPATIYSAVKMPERKKVRVKVAREMDWPVTTVIRISGDYETRKSESGAEIVTRGEVTYSQDVDESDFLQRVAATRRDRRIVLQALASAGGPKRAKGG